MKDNHNIQKKERMKKEREREREQEKEKERERGVTKIARNKETTN